jgi:hypothetical protein
VTTETRRRRGRLLDRRPEIVNVPLIGILDADLLSLHHDEMVA